MNTASAEDRKVTRSRRGIILALPLAIAVGLLALFYAALNSGDPQKLPSVLIGKPVPQFALAPIPAEGGGAAWPSFSSGDLAQGEPGIVNFWASWCAPCIVEHPVLMALSRESGVPVFGINYKDKPDAARKFIGRYGNPYKAIGVDDTGRTAIDFGVYGVPETYVIDGKGRIVLRHAGPLTPEAVEQQIKPALASAKASS